MISVAEALRRVLGSIDAPVEAETVPLAAAAGRTLAAHLAALRTQPPFPASAMDGYAVRAADVASVPAALRVVGRSIAGPADVARLARAGVRTLLVGESLMRRTDVEGATRALLGGAAEAEPPAAVEPSAADGSPEAAGRAVAG